MTHLTETGARLAALGVATLHEATGRGPVARNLRLLVGEPFAGRAVTIALPAGDNLGVHLAIEGATAGDVVCVASAGGGTYGVLGDLLLETARAKRLSGLVIDDGIRDAATLAAPPSIAARGLSAHGTVKRRLRQPLGSAVALDTLFVRHGDYVVCDHDGVCVVPSASLAATLEAAEAREAKEAGLRAAFTRGKRSSDLLGLPTPPVPTSLSD
jgi:4-hydroxy-4-methyl-2-oxoglutarate aldolase